MITDQIAAERSSPPHSEPVQSDILTNVSSRMTEIEQHLRTLIRQRPVVAILTAVGAGYLVARLLSRALR